MPISGGIFPWIPVQLISKEVIRTNEFAALQIRKFEMIPKELDHEEGELTATQKIKRNVLEEQF